MYPNNPENTREFTPEDHERIQKHDYKDEAEFMAFQNAPKTLGWLETSFKMVHGDVQASVETSYFWVEFLSVYLESGAISQEEFNEYKLNFWPAGEELPTEEDPKELERIKNIRKLFNQKVKEAQGEKTDPLKLTDIKGLGEKTRAKLKTIGVTTIEDLTKISPKDFPEFAKFIEAAKEL